MVIVQSYVKLPEGMIILNISFVYGTHGHSLMMLNVRAQTTEFVYGSKINNMPLKKMSSQ